MPHSRTVTGSPVQHCQIQETWTGSVESLMRPFRIGRGLVVRFVPSLHTDGEVLPAFPTETQPGPLLLVDNVAQVALVDAEHFSEFRLAAVLGDGPVQCSDASVHGEAP